MLGECTATLRQQAHDDDGGDIIQGIEIGFRLADDDGGDAAAAAADAAVTVR